MDIPKSAKRCPHCRAKQGIGTFGIIIAILFTILIIPFVLPSSDISTTSAPQYGTYRVEAAEFAEMDPKVVNLWASYSDRTKQGEVAEGQTVTVTNYNNTHNYCYIETDTQEGWASCEWLVRID